MGCVFVPYSAEGHVNPMLPVAAELVRGGVPVRVVAGPRFAARIAATGAVPVVPALDHEVGVPPRWTASTVAHQCGLVVRRRRAWRSAMLACAADFLADPPDLMVVDVRLTWPFRLARRYGIPVVRFHSTFAGRPRTPDHALVNAIPELQPRYESFGSGFTFVGPLIASSRTDAVETYPPGPRILVSAGTVFARSASFYRDIIDEFAGTAWRVFLATGRLPVAALGQVPANVVARGWFPQLSMLRGVDVFLTHGGMNSVHESLAAGVPMLLAPRSREQHGTAGRLIGLRCGLPAAGTVRRSAERLIEDESVRAALSSMRDRMRPPLASELAADQLCQLLSRGRS